MKTQLIVKWIIKDKNEMKMKHKNILKMKNKMKMKWKFIGIFILKWNENEIK